VGGLVGEAAGTISDSYALGNVEGGGQAGGLVGFAVATISTSFATGKVRGFVGTMYEGGIVGQLGFVPALNDPPAITNSYATGDVAGAPDGGATGGVMGAPYNANVFVVSSYATGKITGEEYIGGVSGVGCQGHSSIYCFSNDYWDITTSGETKGIGVGSETGVTGDTTAQLQSGLPSGFDPKIWAENPKINHGFPYLINNPPPAN
jgi:hypothetical protein